MLFIKEKFSRDIIRYINGQLFDEHYLSDALVRNDFNKPKGKSCDAIVHTLDCPYELIEEKSASKIDEAIEKFEEMEIHLRLNNKKVTQCVLFYTSLRHYRSIYTVKKKYLYSITPDTKILINKRVPVHMIQRRKKKKRSKRRN